MNKTIKWLKSQELPTGGIAAWPGMGAYPEVTGYLIPTFIDYGEIELARRCRDWLVSIQSDDGSFNGIDGVPRAFDTAAIIEGLRAMSAYDKDKDNKAERKALTWMKTQFMGEYLKESAFSGKIPVYNLRALAIVGGSTHAFIPDENMRTHYFMYALEGLLNMGHVDFVKEQLERVQVDNAENLVPLALYGGGSDTCATAQAACLRLRVGLPAERFIDAVRAHVYPDGSLPHDNRETKRNSWACKFYLDAERLYESNSSTKN